MTYMKHIICHISYASYRWKYPILFHRDMAHILLDFYWFKKITFLRYPCSICGSYWATISQYIHVSYSMPHLIWRGRSRDKIRMFIWKVLPLINAEFRQICNAGYWALTNAAKIIKRWANHSVNLNTIIRIETFINTMLSHSI